MPVLKDLMQPMKKAIDHTNDLVNQGKVKIKYQSVPEKIESNIYSDFKKQVYKIKIKKFL